MRQGAASKCRLEVRGLCSFRNGREARKAPAPKAGGKMGALPPCGLCPARDGRVKLMVKAGALPGPCPARHWRGGLIVAPGKVGVFSCPVCEG